MFSVGIDPPAEDNTIRLSGTSVMVPVNLGTKNAILAIVEPPYPGPGSPALQISRREMVERARSIELYGIKQYACSHQRLVLAHLSPSMSSESCHEEVTPADMGNPQSSDQSRSAVGNAITHRLPRLTASRPPLSTHSAGVSLDAGDGDKTQGSTSTVPSLIRSPLKGELDSPTRPPSSTRTLFEKPQWMWLFFHVLACVGCFPIFKWAIPQLSGQSIFMARLYVSLASTLASWIIGFTLFAHAGRWFEAASKLSSAISKHHTSC
jgi:hypothetical protein